MQRPSRRGLRATWRDAVTFSVLRREVWTPVAPTPTPILAALSPHISTNHTSVVLGATGGLTILGATLLLIRPRRREPGPADKPKG